jgi:hypothetical protein
MNNSINAIASTSSNVPVEKFLTPDRLIKIPAIVNDQEDDPIDFTGFILQVWYGDDSTKMVPTEFNPKVETPYLEFLSWERIDYLRKTIMERFEKTGERIYSYCDNSEHWTSNGLHIESHYLYSLDKRMPHILFVSADSPNVEDLFKNEGAMEIDIRSINGMDPVRLMHYAAAIGRTCCEISTRLNGPNGPNSVSLYDEGGIKQRLFHNDEFHTFKFEGPQWKLEEMKHLLDQMFDVVKCPTESDFIVRVNYTPNDGDTRKKWDMGVPLKISTDPAKEDLVRAKRDASYWNPFKV